MIDGVRKIAKKTLRGQIYNKVVLPKHLAIAVAENIKHKFPGSGLTIVGVTGTNGKTSTCFMIHRMLVEAGHNPGLMTTVAYGVGNNLNSQIHHMTSQPIGLLFNRLEEMKSRGMDILVLEVTSHALAQFRTMGLPIDIAVMTNVTHEHLDYHGSFEAYKNAKLKLFKSANRNKTGKRLGIINADDENASWFVDAIDNVMAYSLNESKDENVVWPQNLIISAKGSQYTTKVNGQKLRITCNLPGSFNVANSLAAVCVGSALGLNKSQIEQGISALKSVEGRMMRINEGQDFDVIVDFAHTPDSFKKLFSDLRPAVKGKLISLFGSAGQRDEEKRAIQGKIAGEYSDIVVVTEEDDRDADGVGIMNQIASGAKESAKRLNEDLFLIHDRTKAIKFALEQAKKGDTVLLLGKGHEKTIERATGESPWDEVGTVRKFLRERTRKREVKKVKKRKK
jgi:UDP-N-acetylmuramoyl-L-alanyl-D-glutamate--2,6-diaminopimelate ligase